MQWDIFCRVVDNYGDIGVCWRLCADLTARGERVRLWVDDASALAWMAPLQNQSAHPVQVLMWQQATQPQDDTCLPCADVWIEAFGCDIPEAFMAYYAAQQSAISKPSNAKAVPSQPIWLNLEYLSAESYVDRTHTLSSPQMHGAAKGWTKYFFYPGFTHQTGGLLREDNLAQRQTTFDQEAKRQWLNQHGIAWLGERLVSLFCYEPLALGALLNQLSHASSPTTLLVSAGRATAAVRAYLGAVVDGVNSAAPVPIYQHHQHRQYHQHHQLRLHFLPYLSQTDFDHLLWVCDLNCVRGEDSLVRAIWAGKALLWNIYPQDDGAHADKLSAFLQLWGQVMAASSELPQSLVAWHGLWNSTANPQDCASDLIMDLPHWSSATQALRQYLLHQPDLCQQLLRFVRDHMQGTAPSVGIKMQPSTKTR